MNMFTIENLKAAHPNGTVNIGEIVNRNGIQSMRIAPDPFYTPDNDWRICKGQFNTNTSYVFDLWLDSDDVYYDGISANVPGGLFIKYTDGTRTLLNVIGNRDNPVGFQHIHFVSPSNKTIDGIGVYYYVSVPVYYRTDSFFAPVKSVRVDKNGIVEFNNNSDFSANVGFVEGGLIKANDFYEY